MIKSFDYKQTQMTAKEHYDNHLGDFYSWMIGDFESKAKEFQDFLKDNSIFPTNSKNAIDLGAGHGIQSVALAKLGFNVIAVDFNEQLLNELKRNSNGLKIEIVNDDIKNVRQFSDKAIELILCCGDTLSHLNDKNEIKKLIHDTSTVLKPNGKILFSFRDYSTELTEDNRFLPVKSDDNRILTCVLDYEKERVRVTDLLHEKTETGWKQKVSSYFKVRILTNEIIEMLESFGFKIQLNSVINRMTNVIAIKI